MLTDRRSAIVSLAFLGTLVLTASSPRTEDGNWDRLRSMPLERRAHLHSQLKAFDLLTNVEKESVRSLDRKLAAEPEEDRGNYYEVLRRYHLWVESLPESKREELNATPPNKRLALVSKIRTEQSATGRRESTYFQLAEIRNISPYNVAELVKIWLELTPAEQAAVSKVADNERRPKLLQLGREKKIASVTKPNHAAMELTFDHAIKRFPELKKQSDELVKVQFKEGFKHRVADHYAFLENPPAKVKPEQLLLFDRAIPSWVRSGLEPLPPDEARRRLTILYRIIFPAGTEMKPKAPARAAVTNDVPARPVAPPTAGKSVPN